LVGYCGLYCGECHTYRGRIITTLAVDFKELLEAGDHPDWVPKFGSIDFDYEEFLKGLTYYSREDSGCFNNEPCKDGCGVPGCQIDDCAKEMGIDICFECDEFPCNHFSMFLKRHPEHLKDYAEFKRLGKDEWLKRHVQRAERGYCLASNKYYTKAR